MTSETNPPDSIALLQEQLETYFPRPQASETEGDKPTESATSGSAHDLLVARIEELKQTADAAPTVYKFVHAHNKSLPIHKLPLEIFIDIIKYVLPSFEPVLEEDYFDRLHTLAQVSSIWATIFKTHSHLWAIANGADKYARVQRALRMSKSAPLVVQWDCTGEICGMQPQCELNLFWEAACSHICRWKSALMVVSNAEELQALRQLVPIESRGAAANLKHFMLLVGRDDGDGLETGTEHEQTKVNLLDGHAPRLERLILGNASIRDWRPDVFGSLRILMITSVAPPGPTVDQMTEILRRCCDSLILLAIHDLELRITGPPDATEHASIVLQRLQVLSLVRLRTQPMIILMDRLQTPRATTYKCVRDLENEDDTSMDEQFTNSVSAHVRPSFTAYCKRKKPSRLVLKWCRGKVRLTGYADEASTAKDAIGFDVHLGKMSIVRVAPWISEALADSDSNATKPRVEVSFEGVHTETEAQEVMDSLTVTKDATTLCLVVVAEHQLRTILASLSAPVKDAKAETGEGSGCPTVIARETWICPRISHLRFECCRIKPILHPAVLDLARARAPNRIGWEDSGPAALTSVRITGDRADLKEDANLPKSLKEILGEDAVKWTKAGSRSATPVADGADSSDSEDEFGEDIEYAMTI